MKYLNKIFLVALLFAPFFLSSCGDDNSTTPDGNTGEYKFSCVVNGGGFTNQAYSFDVTAGAIANPADNITGCSFADALGNAASITFGGTAKGNFTIDEDKNQVVITVNGVNIVFGLTSGTIKVTTYDKVGGDIAGTFSGSGIVYKDNQEFNVTITNGIFRAKRLV
jgi:hypothetical protein